MGRLRAPWGLYKRLYTDGTDVWWYYVWDGDKRRRFTTGQVTKARAMAVITQRLRDGTMVPDKSIGETVREFSDELWKWDGPYFKRRRLREDITRAYVESHGSRFKNHVYPILGDWQIKDVTVEDLEQLFQDLAEKMATGSANLIYFAARTVWSAAHRAGKIPSNPMLQITKLANRTKPRTVLTLAEALPLMARQWWSTDMEWALNLVAATTGARLGEICALRVCDIQKDRVWIGATVRQLEGVVKDTKTGEKGKRWSAIPPSVYKACLPWITGRDPEHFAFNIKHPLKPTGARYATRGLQEAIQAYNADRVEHEEASIPRVVFHAWRHLVVSTLSSRCHPDSVSLHVGHAVAGVKGIYLHQTEEHIMECLKALTDVWG